ncbi:glucosaminidase domain-containing protein [Paenibacillus glycanilyticus]|uniref:glucosaminidase domain-containing protein n=1 Tax=Paenibacillus glycanilyticus TaxID=126569 RepID=UPI0020407A98|nr:glucosaminidase domain-containing protein [Paenibacillus glycanilyticus]MCM3628633.1 glucosaminidase domain-containing protein [Paenibacillus glycanilyticus]
MHTKLNRQVLLYVLCIALFMTLGTRFLPSNKVSAEVTHDLSSAHLTIDEGNIVASEALQLFTPQLPEAAGLNQSERQEAILPEPEPSTIPEVHSAIAPASVEEPPVHTYEVTAYYLNVREQPDANSNIIQVLKQGDTVKVDHTTDNGWLALSGQGFVHGRYAERVEGKETATAKSVGEVKAQSLAKAKTIAVEAPLNDTLEIKPVLELPSKPERPSSAVESESGLTEEHIAKLFEKTALANHGLEKAILDIEEEYGINAYFTIAVMKLESGNGKSTLAKKKNNLFGLNAIDSDKYNKAFSFATKGDSVRKFGQLLARNYINKGFTTIDKVASKYCPANPKWASLVMNIMKRDYKKL